MTVEACREQEGNLWRWSKSLQMYEWWFCFILSFVYADGERQTAEEGENIEKWRTEKTRSGSSNINKLVFQNARISPSLSKPTDVGTFLLYIFRVSSTSAFLEQKIKWIYLKAKPSWTFLAMEIRALTQLWLRNFSFRPRRRSFVISQTFMIATRVKWF